MNAQLAPELQIRDLVTYTIKIDGETLPQELKLSGLTVCKEVARIPSAKLIIIDGSPGSQDFSISNQPWFVPGKEIEIFLGYRSDETRVFKGIIVNHRLSVRLGFSNIEIDCRDAAYRMTLRRKSRYFEALSDSDLAAQLIDAYQLSHDMAATEHQHAELVQYDVSDWDFLLMRMEFNDLITMLDDGAFTIAPPDFNQQSEFRLEYGRNVLEFDGELELRDQFEEVSARSWDYSNQELLERTAAEPDIQANGNLPASDIMSANQDEPIIHRHGGHVVEDELQAWADARLLKDRLSRTRGRVRFHGNPELKPGQLIELQGLGDRYNGVVFVAGVRHEFDRGVWLTDLEFGLSPQWFAQSVTIERPAAAGMLAAVGGLQIGVVTQIEDDPDGDFRIRIRLPIVDNEAEGIWARMATLDAGSERGTFFLPEVGDEVIVGFINDDPRDAVVLGMLYSRAKPPPFTASEDNLEKGYVSREGLRLVFHEEDKSISLQTPGGNSIVISDDEKGLVLSDQNGNSIRLNDNGISFNSETDIEFKAKNNVKTKAQNKWSAEASAQVELQANGVATIKGNPVNIN
jgi:Rhs element Vgr protein